MKFVLSFVPMLSSRAAVSGSLVLTLLFSPVCLGRDWKAEGLEHQQVLRWAQSLKPIYRPHSYQPSLGIEIEGRYPFPKDESYSILGLAADEFVRANSLTEHSLLIKETQSTVLYEANGFSQKLEFKADPTIVPIDNFQNFEMNSAIIRNDLDRDFFSRLVRELNFKIGLIPAPLSGGVHFHIGFENPTMEEVALFSFLFSSVHEQLKSLYHVTSQREENYAKPLSAEEFKWLLAFLYANKNHLQERLGHRTMIVSRARALNWQAYQKYQTVEIRLVNSSFNPVILNSMSDFLVKLVTAIRTKSPELLTYLAKTPPNQIELLGLAKVIEAELANARTRDRIRKITKLELENEFSRVAGIQVIDSVFACESILFY